MFLTYEGKNVSDSVSLTCQIYEDKKWIQIWNKSESDIKEYHKGKKDVFLFLASIERVYNKHNII